MRSSVKLRPWPCADCGVDTFQPGGGVAFHTDDADPDSPDLCLPCKRRHLAERQCALRLAQRV